MLQMQKMVKYFKSKKLKFFNETEFYLIKLNKTWDKYISKKPKTIKNSIQRIFINCT